MSANRKPKKRPSHKKQPQVPVTWAEAFRDIITEAQRRGQIVLYAFIILVMGIFWRLPEEELVHVIRSITRVATEQTGLGYVLAAIVVVFWVLNVKKLRSSYHAEIKRVSDEKSKLHKRLMSIPPKSSKNV